MSLSCSFNIEDFRQQVKYGIRTGSKGVIQEIDIVNALYRVWPIRYQYKVDIQLYLDAVQKAFDCSVDKVNDDLWDEKYEISIDGFSWTLECGHKNYQPFIIFLNECLPVGYPEDTVKMISVVNGLLPELRAYCEWLSNRRIKRNGGVPPPELLTYDPKKYPINSSIPNNSITKELLNRKFVEYNQLYFSNKLTFCPISICSIKALRPGKRKKHCAYYNPNPRCSLFEAIDCEIVIDTLVTYCYDVMIRSVLLHEMIHHFVRTCFPKSRIESSHGPTFQRIRRQLNLKYNLGIDKPQTKEALSYDIQQIEI